MKREELEDYIITTIHDGARKYFVTKENWINDNMVRLVPKWQQPFLHSKFFSKMFRHFGWGLNIVNLNDGNNLFSERIEITHNGKILVTQVFEFVIAGPKK